MDFSNDFFRHPTTNSTFSNDTMDHAKLVMACRFGWTRSAELSDTGAHTPVVSHPTSFQAPLTTLTNDQGTRRFTPCRGRLYHQLACSHRIRTDIVEDCGSNCLDPLTDTSNAPFYCHECFEQEATTIYSQREAEHNAAYPPLDQMTKGQYNQWYDEHRRFEAQYLRDRNIYQVELRAKTRPSNSCSAIETSKEEKEFAAELDSLSLALVPSNDSIVKHPQTRVNRVCLPTDASEQLHWGLDTLALDRGSCGVEYNANQPSGCMPTLTRNSDDDDLWRKSKNREWDHNYR